MTDDKTREAIEKEAKIWADAHYPNSRTYETKDTSGYLGFIIGAQWGIDYRTKELAEMAGQDILKKILTSFHRFAPTGYSGLLDDPISQWSRHCEKLIRETYERTAMAYEARIAELKKERDELKAKLD